MATNQCRPLPQFTAEQIEKFWSCVDKRGPDDCWIWKRGTNQSGYGKFWAFGEFWIASRVVLSLKAGEDPGNKIFAAHTCDTPPCCNPAHLFAATTRENALDMTNKNRCGKGSTHWSHVTPDKVLRGERNGSAKLTSAVVREIQAALAGSERRIDIAARFGISRKNLWLIQRGKAWATSKLECTP